MCSIRHSWVWSTRSKSAITLQIRLRRSSPFWGEIFAPQLKGRSKRIVFPVQDSRIRGRRNMRRGRVWMVIWCSWCLPSKTTVLKSRAWSWKRVGICSATLLSPNLRQSSSWVRGTVLPWIRTQSNSEILSLLTYSASRKNERSRWIDSFQASNWVT